MNRNRLELNRPIFWELKLGRAGTVAAHCRDRIQAAPAPDDQAP
jgi:hypothetical protein